MTAATMLTLRQFVASKLADGVTDYLGAAREIVDLIPDEDRDEFLVQAVMTVISEINGQRRRAAFDAAKYAEDTIVCPGPETSDETGHGRGVTQVPPAGLVGSTEDTAPPVPTSRPQRFRTYWQNLIEQVGLAADGGRKRIGDMDAEDLRANISYRERLADENVSRARQFTELLSLLESQHVTVVDEITPPSGGMEAV